MWACHSVKHTLQYRIPLKLVVLPAQYTLFDGCDTRAARMLVPNRLALVCQSLFTRLCYTAVPAVVHHRFICGCSSVQQSCLWSLLLTSLPSGVLLLLTRGSPPQPCCLLLRLQWGPPGDTSEPLAC